MSVENERIADLLTIVARLGIGRKPKERAFTAPPLGVSLHLDRARLEKIGVQWTPEAVRATNYAHWLRIHPQFVCCYCGQSVPQGRRARHADHILPLSQGGLHVAENIAPACRRCNQTKRADILTDRPAIAPHLMVASWQPKPPPPLPRSERKGIRGPDDWDEKWFAAWCEANA